MLIVGCGYIGRRLATRASGEGDRVSGTVRSESSLQALRAIGIDALRVDLDRGGLPSGRTAGERIYYLAPPPAEGGIDTRMRHFIAGFTVSGQPRRIVYISTTGVYGDCQGEWVDESRAVNPQVDRAQRRWDAEQQLRAWRDASGGELVILRVAGIYGPGKLPLARLRKGIPMVAEADAPWTNRIHAEDLVETCVQAMQHGVDGAVYNVSDGHPGNMTDYFNRVADLAGLERPATISLEQAREALSPGLMSYLGESRRLSNRRMREELGVKLRYPTLDEGLPASFPAGD